MGAHRFLGGTFHHVGGQVLTTYSEIQSVFREILLFLDDGDSDALLSEVIRDLDPDFFKSKENPKAKPIKGMISYSRNVMVPVEEVAKGRYPSNGELLAKIDAFMREYQDTKISRGLADYDDLLGLVASKFSKQTKRRLNIIKNDFLIFLVDEYQDVNSLQSKIVDKIGLTIR